MTKNKGGFLAGVGCQHEICDFLKEHNIVISTKPKNWFINYKKCNWCEFWIKKCSITENERYCWCCSRKFRTVYRWKGELSTARDYRDSKVFY